MVKSTLIFLAEFSLELGLIGIDEHDERVKVALWLSEDRPGESDPRLINGEKGPEISQKEEYNKDVVKTGDKLDASPENDEHEDNILKFVAWSTWYFTGSDPDPYPSVPHGHYQSAINKWPKLNPYTGRVFSQKHQEDNSKRLNKKEMQKLWRDVNFRNYCRTHVMWYLQAHSHYRFLVRHPLRFPRW